MLHIVPERLNVYIRLPLSVPQIAHEIEGAQETRAKGRQRLLAAWIGGCDCLAVLQIVLFVDSVDKYNARLCPIPCRPHYRFPEGPGVDEPVYLSFKTEWEETASVNSTHKLVSNSNAEIKPTKFIIILFSMDELLYIRMIHSQNAHLGSPALAGRGYHRAKCVKHFQETNWPCSVTVKGTYNGISRANGGEIITDPSATPHSFSSLLKSA